MSGKFIDILFSFVITLRWRWVVLCFLLFFAGSWWATDYFEPACKVTSPDVFWWYFTTTILRGGYADYTPITAGARIVSLLTFFLGGVFFIVPICKISSSIFEHIQRRKKGAARLNMKNHIVLLGYRKGETEEIIKQILADYQTTRPSSIVLCTRNLAETPYPGHSLISFVQGDTASDDVLERACVKDANKVVISGHEDARTMAICLAVNAIASKDAHIVAYVEDKANARFLRKINRNIECVTSLRTMLIAQAVMNPGSSSVLHSLADLASPPTVFKIGIPEDVPAMPFSAVMDNLLHQYDVIPIAVGYADTPDVHFRPDAKSEVKGGMSLYYIGENRIDGIIRWDTFRDPLIIEEANKAQTSEVRISLLAAVPS